MKITLVISSLGSGGAERVLSMLAGAWHGRGDDVTIVTLSGRESDFHSLPPGIRRVALGLMRDAPGFASGIAGNARRVRAIRAAVQELKPEAVISFMDKTNVLTLLATRGTGIPVIVSERTDPRHYGEVSGLWGRLRRLMYPRAQAVVVQTGEVARWAEEIGCRADRVRVVPNPVEVPTDTGERPPVPQGGRRVLAVGRMDRWKGFDLLLRAFAKCRVTAPEWHLTVLGDGPERPALERLSAELAVADRVLFPGRVANPGDWMRASDLFVMSSLYEGFPNALLEAMACGMAVVSFDCPSGPREIIRNGIDGVLVPPRDCDALAAAMAGLMRDDAARRGLGAEALKVVDRFSLERVVAMWDSVIAGASAQRK